MKVIGLILKNIKTLIPYFFLIALYFFFLNLEVLEEKQNKFTTGPESQLDEKKSRVDDKKQIRISIPVFPYME